MVVKTQKVRFDAVCIGKEWSRLTDSNRRPTDYKSVALPAELSRLIQVEGDEFHVIFNFFNKKI